MKANKFTATYLIKTTKEPTKLLGEDFRGLTKENCMIEIENQKYQLKKEHIFSKEGLTTVNFIVNQNAKISEMRLMFFRCENLISVNLSELDMSNVKNINCCFGFCELLNDIGDLSLWNCKKIKEIIGMFINCASLTEINLSPLDLSEVIETMDLFRGCSNLINVNIGNLNPSKIFNTKGMFAGCKSIISINMEKFNFPEDDNDFKGMFIEANDFDFSYKAKDGVDRRETFLGCSALKEIKGIPKEILEKCLSSL